MLVSGVTKKLENSNCLLYQYLKDNGSGCLETLSKELKLSITVIIWLICNGGHNYCLKDGIVYLG